MIAMIRVLLTGNHVGAANPAFITLLGT